MNLFANDDTRDFLNNLFRVGRVVSLDCAKCTARVVFGDDDDVVSYDLQVMQRNTQKNHDYAMPDIDELVLCFFLPSGVSTGFILGSIYASDITPPESTEDKRTVVFADGSRFSYDRKTRQLDIQIEETTIIANTESVKINTPVSVDVIAGQKVTVNTPGVVDVVAGQKVTVNTPGVVEVEAGSEVTVTAPQMTFNGDITVNGMVTVSGDVIGGGKVSLVSHVHTGNLGAPTTPPVQ